MPARRFELSRFFHQKDPDLQVQLEQLRDEVNLLHGSVFSDDARLDAAEAAIVLAQSEIADLAAAPAGQDSFMVDGTGGFTSAVPGFPPAGIPFTVPVAGVYEILWGHSGWHPAGGGVTSELYIDGSLIDAMNWFHNLATVHLTSPTSLVRWALDPGTRYLGIRYSHSSDTNDRFWFTGRRVA